MLLECLVKSTVELQGIRAANVNGDTGGLATELAPNWARSKIVTTTRSPGTSPRRWSASVSNTRARFALRRIVNAALSIVALSLNVRTLDTVVAKSCSLSE